MKGPQPTSVWLGAASRARRKAARISSGLSDRVRRAAVTASLHATRKTATAHSRDPALPLMRGTILRPTTCVKAEIRTCDAFRIEPIPYPPGYRGGANVGSPGCAADAIERAAYRTMILALRR